MADRRPHAVGTDWADKFYLSNAVIHKYQGRRAVFLAIELMFQALENDEYPYFKSKGKPEFWKEFKDYWVNVQNYVYHHENQRKGVGFLEKYPASLKSEKASMILKDFWDLAPVRKSFDGKVRAGKTKKDKPKTKKQISEENKEKHKGVLKNNRVKIDL